MADKRRVRDICDCNAPIPKGRYKYCSNECMANAYKTRKNYCSWFLCNNKITGYKKHKYCSEDCAKKDYAIKGNVLKKSDKFLGTKKGKWAEWEDDYIIKHYQQSTAYKMVKPLNRSVLNIQARIQKLIKEGKLKSKLATRRKANKFKLVNEKAKEQKTSYIDLI